MMDLFEEIYEYVAKKVNGSTKVSFRGKEIDFKRPWKRMTMADCIKKYAKKFNYIITPQKTEALKKVWQGYRNV